MRADLGAQVLERMCKRGAMCELAFAERRDAFMSAAVRGGLVAGARCVVVIVLVLLWRGMGAGRRSVRFG